MFTAADACICKGAQLLRAGASHLQQTLYLGIDAGSVHAVSIECPADALRNGGGNAAADHNMSRRNQHNPLKNLYQAVRMGEHWGAVRMCRFTQLQGHVLR